MLHVLEAVEGGTARHVVDVVRYVNGVQHHVAVPARRVGGLTDEAAARRMQDAGASVHFVAMTRSPVSAANARAIFELRRVVRDVGADIIHGHSSIGGVLARVVARSVRRPCVYTPNGVAPGRLAVAVERALARGTQRIIAVSASEADLLRGRRIATGPRVVVIPNGVEIEPADATPFDLRGRLQIAADAPLVGTVARLVPQKAPERFIAVASAVHRERPDAHFVLIGDGPLRATVDEAAASSGLDATFHRLPELPDAEGVLGQLDVFVSTSRFEGGPYSPLEAMRAATPVVLSDVVGNRDVVEHGRSGLLAPENAATAFAALVLELLGDDERRRSLGAAGRTYVRDRFDVVKSGRMLADVYGSLVAQPPGHL